MKPGLSPSRVSWARRLFIVGLMGLGWVGRRTGFRASQGRLGETPPCWRVHVTAR